MFDFLKKKTEINTTQIVDEIEAAVYEHVKPYGFKKHGRTLHRFVSEDISQVIHFQSGMPTHGMSGLLCVKLKKAAELLTELPMYYTVWLIPSRRLQKVQRPYLKIRRFRPRL